MNHLQSYCYTVQDETEINTTLSTYHESKAVPNVHVESAPDQTENHSATTDHTMLTVTETESHTENDQGTSSPPVLRRS